MTQQITNGLFIFRRDLRIEDNKALSSAMENCKNVYTIFIFTPEQVTPKNIFKSEAAITFMIQSLQELNVSIEEKNGSLLCFYNDNIDMIESLIEKWKIDVVYFNKDISPYARKRDNDIEKLCIAKNISCITKNDYYLTLPDSIKTSSNTPYTKFTPYYKKVLSQSKLIDKPSFKKKWNFAKQTIKIDNSISLKDAKEKFCNQVLSTQKVIGGRKHALQILKKINYFTKYADTRNDLEKNTTLLSAYIKFGNVSIREVFHTMKKNLGINHDLIKQLIWRDFYAQLLYNQPYVLGNPLKKKYENINWENKNDYFNHWKEGTTGFPIVDAGMRELNQTGYMHNRARLITASFLVKTLLIDWQKGEQYFATKLIDYDPASNNGNWQWVASTGADSQPYFRIFNPWSQSTKHDPNCKYIQKWIPELKEIPVKSIHQWYEKWELHLTTYPKPIVDYKVQREKALSMYKQVID